MARADELLGRLTFACAVRIISSHLIRTLEHALKKLIAAGTIAVGVALLAGATSTPRADAGQEPLREIGYAERGEVLRSSKLDAESVVGTADMLVKAKVASIGAPIVLSDIERGHPIVGNVVTYSVIDALGTPLESKVLEVVIPEQTSTARVGTTYMVAARRGQLFDAANVLLPIWIGELVADDKYADAEHELELAPATVSSVAQHLAHPIKSAPTTNLEGSKDA